MYFIITVDVEEENWGDFENKNPPLRHIDKLSNLQELFDRYGIKATYLLTYPAATDNNTVSILSRIAGDGRCEIGSHLHPFSTPPFEEEINAYNSMLCNLPKDLQYKKMERLHETIYKNLGVESVSFRSGRWACDEGVWENLSKLNYIVDTSVISYTDWSSDHGPDYSGISPSAYKILLNGNPNPHILEIPATVGYLQAGFNIRNKILRAASDIGLQKLRFSGILNRLKLINKIWLSPEVTEWEKMVGLARTMEKERYEILNMFFHSPSLMAGCTPYTKTRKEAEILIHRIEKFLDFAVMNNFKSMTTSEYARLNTSSELRKI